MRKELHVAVSVITNSANQILVALRPSDKPQSNVWEFPGGKIEAGETSEQAVIREVYEEVGITPSCIVFLKKYSHLYRDTQFYISVFHINNFTGEAYGKEGQLIKWVNPTELFMLPMLVGNSVILEAIQTQILIHQAINVIKSGEVIAYPTEAVYGLGCDPSNESAVHKILRLKRRSVEQGVILVGSNLLQFSSYIAAIPTEKMQEVSRTWPGPVTWLFPASSQAPAWIRGAHATIAIRVTDHPLVRLLCNQSGGPIVSTSANLHGQPALQTAQEVAKVFSNQVFILPGNTGGLSRPTEIRHALSGALVRAG